MPPIISEPQQESRDYSNGLALEPCDEEPSPAGDADAQINGLDDTEMQLLEDDDIFALSDETNDVANIAEAKCSLDDKILPFFVEMSSFYRLVLALYRVARLITRQHTIERDVDCLEIRAGAFAELQSSASSAACSTFVPYDSFLSIIIAIVMEVGH